MSRGLPKQVRNLLQKSRCAAMDAVAAYNNPYASFRTGTFISHMQIGWTALMLAAFLRKKLKPYERAKNGRYIRMNGRQRFWGVGECVLQYFGSGKGGADPVANNILFFSDLRDMIEHAEMPEIDLEVFGECQSLLYNFEDALAKDFGDRYAMGLNLTPAIQFSRYRPPEQLEAIRKLQSPLAKDVFAYVDAFRSSLTAQVLGDQRYSYKLFMLPNVGNHRSKDSLAVEWIPYDPGNPQHDEMSEKLAAIIKLKSTSTIRQGHLRPGQVCERVNKRLGEKKISTNLHSVCCEEYGARPPHTSPEPGKTNPAYCSYDPTFNNWSFTEQWVEFLASKIGDATEYERLKETSRQRRKKKAS